MIADYNDLFLALQIIGDVLNQSYTTIEPRIQQVLDEIKKHDDWIPRSEIVKALNLKGKKKMGNLFRIENAESNRGKTK